MSNIGHNSEDLSARLRASYQQLLKRKDELLGSMARVPTVITDDDMQRKVSDLAVMITDCAKQSEAAREAEKAPYLEGGRTVDGFFVGGIKEPLDDAKKKLLRLGGEYLRAKKEAEEKARQAEIDAAAERARIAFDAAQDLERKGQRELSNRLLNEAVASETHADVAAAEFQKASTGDLVRTRSSLGSLSTLKEQWVCTNYARDALDLESLRHHFSDDAIRKAINSWMKANKGAIEQGSTQLAGAEIIKEASASYRR